jgi:hypothetical protein
MGMRAVVAALVLALVGLAGGYVAADLLRDEPTVLATARPVRASNPSIPVDPERPFAPDIGYPPLRPGLDYVPRTLGDPPFRWSYRAPVGWTPTVESFEEIRWRPADEPLVGGFSLRVKLTNEHKSPPAMLEQKLAALQELYDDVEILGRTQDLLSISYRDPSNNRLRFNSFRWFGTPDDSETFEMSVVGREAARAGLDDLFEQVARSIAPEA